MNAECVLVAEGEIRLWSGLHLKCAHDVEDGKQVQDDDAARDLGSSSESGAREFHPLLRRATLGSASQVAAHHV
jgi:hypothetical protein